MGLSLQKEKYLDTIQSVEAKKACIRAFNYLEPLEQEMQIDCSQATPEQNSDMVDRILSKNRNRGWVLVYQLYLYDQWCLKKSLTSSSPFVGFSHPEMDDVLKKYVSSPQDLNLVMDEFLNDERKNTVDNALRSYLWFLFMGINADDAFKIKREHIDFDQMVVRLDNKVYKIYPEAAYSIRSSASMDSFLYIHPGWENMKSYTTWRQRADGDLVLRRFRENNYSRAKFNKRIRSLILDAQATKHIRKNIIPVYVRYSGAFYRAYEDERELGLVSKESLYEAISESGIEFYTSQSANVYLSLYYLWKLAYYTDFR